MAHSSAVYGSLPHSEAASHIKPDTSWIRSPASAPMTATASNHAQPSEASPRTPRFGAQVLPARVEIHSASDPNSEPVVAPQDVEMTDAPGWSGAPLAPPP